jgi:transposase
MATIVDPKVAALMASGCLNPRPEAVGARLFAVNVFFDARDLVQVKYEMVRRVRQDRVPVTAAVAEFGLSRPTFYQAAAALDESGPAGLIPRRPGPRGGHKLTGQVMERVAAWMDEQPGLRSQELADRIVREFGVRVHRRSVERALARRRAAGPKSR